MFIYYDKNGKILSERSKSIDMPLFGEKNKDYFVIEIKNYNFKNYRVDVSTKKLVEIQDNVDKDAEENV